MHATTKQYQWQVTGFGMFWLTRNLKILKIILARDVKDAVSSNLFLNYFSKNFKFI